MICRRLKMRSILKRIFSLHLIFNIFCLLFFLGHFRIFSPDLISYLIKIIKNDRRPDILSALATYESSWKYQKLFIAKKLYSKMKYVFPLELWSIKWKATNTLKIKILKFHQIKLNNIQNNVTCLSARFACNTQCLRRATIIAQQLKMTFKGEGNIIGLFFKT